MWTFCSLSFFFFLSFFILFLPVREKEKFQKSFPVEKGFTRKEKDDERKRKNWGGRNRNYERRERNMERKKKEEKMEKYWKKLLKTFWCCWQWIFILLLSSSSFLSLLLISEGVTSGEDREKGFSSEEKKRKEKDLKIEKEWIEKGFESDGMNWNFSFFFERKREERKKSGEKEWVEWKETERRGKGKWRKQNVNQWLDLREEQTWVGSFPLSTDRKRRAFMEEEKKRKKVRERKQRKGEKERFPLNTNVVPISIHPYLDLFCWKGRLNWGRRKRRRREWVE